MGQKTSEISSHRPAVGVCLRLAGAGVVVRDAQILLRPGNFAVSEDGAAVNLVVPRRARRGPRQRGRHEGVGHAAHGARRLLVVVDVVVAPLRSNLHVTATPVEIPFERQYIENRFFFLFFLFFSFFLSLLHSTFKRVETRRPSSSRVKRASSQLAPPKPRVRWRTEGRRFGPLRCVVTQERSNSKGVTLETNYFLIACCFFFTV